MKIQKFSQLSHGLFMIGFLVLCLGLLPQPGRAQGPGLEPGDSYNREELAQMLAPIALYPDTLLAQILMASTYPIEVIEADRWVRNNQGLTGDRLDDALLDQDWDPSVKALCHYPDTLALMSERIAETTALGNAFLAQESEVMDMVQQLREEAYAQGNLKTSSQQKVVVDSGTIIIEPANPGVVYVPYYDPYFVYGPWWWSPAYPPYYWGPVGVDIGAGIFFWPGVYFGVSFHSWSYFDWPHRYIYIDVRRRPRFISHDRWVARPAHWSHLPSHRRGVAYRDKTTARRFGQAPQRPGTFQRDTRGFPERNRIEQRRPGGAPSRTDAYRTDPQRVERNLKDLKKPSQIRPEGQRKTSAQQRPEPQKVSPLKKAPAGNNLKKQAPADVKHRERRVGPDDLFNRADDGRQERRSSERGWNSRQGSTGSNHGDQGQYFRKQR